MGHPIDRESLGPCDPLRAGRLVRAIEQSNRYFAGIRTGPDARRHLDAIVIDALGNGFVQSNCYGTINVGRCIFENTDLAGASSAFAKYDALLAGSNWNAELLNAATGRAVEVIFEGVDTSLFCPAPKSGLLDASKFYVFSGGKVELRKAQDLVLLAFRKFHERRKDSVLVTAWHSPWPKLSEGFKGKLSAPIGLGARGTLDIGKWVVDNGLDLQSVIDLGFVPNAWLPMILREMDVALQPSRAEACTGLPVKEAMACGIPVIAPMNTGMKDLLTSENCLLLTKQTEIHDPRSSSMLGWGESDVDEIVAALDDAYDHRQKMQRIGASARQWLIEHDRTWQAHAHRLKRWILSL